MQIHELGTRTPDTSDYIALDTGTQTYKSTVGNLKPQYTSYDTASPTSWVNVDPVGSHSRISLVFERLTYMFRNIRYLWKLIGSGDFSNVAETISGAIGNTALTTTATDISGAIAEHEGDISDLNAALGTTLFRTSGVGANTNLTLTSATGGVRAVVLINSSTASCRAAYIVSCTGTGSVSYTPILDGSGITITTGSYIFKYTGTSATRVTAIIQSGDLTIG